MNCLAVIPARGGSKRLPGKNIIDFCGKPIIGHTIEAAVDSGLFDRIMVSTEDRAIENISKRYGAQIIRRPMELATDTARVVEVCLHALDTEISHGRSYDILCCLYATAPLRSATDIKNTLELVQSRECDFAMAVTEYHYPVHQAMIVSQDGFLEPMWPDIVNRRSQDVPRMLIDNGSTYAVWVPEFVRLKTFRGPKLKGYFMPRDRSIDIDVMEDLELATYFAKRNVL